MQSGTMQPSGPIGRPSRLAVPVVVSTAPGGRRARARRMRPRARPPPASMLPSAALSKHHALPGPLSLSHTIILSSVTLSRPHPSAADATARRCRGHCLPLAPGHAQELHGVVFVISTEPSEPGRAIATSSPSSSTSQPPRSPAPVHCLRLVPEPADHPVVSTVRFCICSPSSRARLRPVAVALLSTEPRRRPSSSATTLR